MSESSQIKEIQIILLEWNPKLSEALSAFQSFQEMDDLLRYKVAEELSSIYLDQGIVHLNVGQKPNLYGLRLEGLIAAITPLDD